MFSGTRKLIFLPIAAILLFGSLWISQRAQVQIKETKQKTEKKLPSGNWSVSFHPYLKSDFTESPVVVASVTTTQFQVSKFTVVNISQKTIAGIKLKWLVFNEPERRNVLKQDDTPFLRFSKQLQAGTGVDLTYSPVSLHKFYGSFVKNGKLNENFEVELLIDTVEFADGSVWKKEDGKSPDISPLIEARILEDEGGPCPKQKCKSNEDPEVRGGVYYSCETSSLNELCANQPGAKKCDNVACTLADFVRTARKDIDVFESWNK